jgi:hypothetical protein
MYLALVLWERAGPGRPRNETWRTEPVPCPPVWLTQTWPTSRIDGSERWRRLRRARQSSTALQWDELLSALRGASGLMINSTISGNVCVGPGGGSAPVASGNSMIAGNPKRPGDLSDELRAHSHLLR